MKKSFLKRVTAAIVAVPVALTQTALFTSIAADGTTDTTASAGAKTVDMTNIMAVTSTKLTPAKDFKSSAATSFRAKELDYTNAYVQVSDWGDTVRNYVLPGTVKDEKEVSLTEAQKKEFANKITRKGAAADLVRNAIMSKDTNVIVATKQNAVVVTIDINYAYGADLCKMAEDAMNKKIAQRYDDVTVTVTPTALAADAKTDKNRVSGKIVITANMDKVEEKDITFTSSVKFGGTEQKSAKEVEDYFVAEAKKALTNLKADAGKAVETAIADAQTQINNKQSELNTAVQKLNAGKATLSKWKNKLAELEAAEKELNEKREAAAAAGQNTEEAVKELKNKVKTLRAELEAATEKIAKGDAQALEAQKKLNDAQKLVDDAWATANENLQSYADDLMNKILDYQKKADKYVDKTAKDGSFKTSAPAANFDAVLAAADKKVPKLPASLNGVKEYKRYSLLSELFNVAMNQASASAGAKINVTTDDVLAVAAQGYDVNAAIETANYTAKGETLFYVKDDLSDAASETIKKHFNNTKELLTANKEVDALYSVKVVEAKGNVDENKLSGEAALDVYRVVWFTTKDKATEPSSESSEPSSEPTEPSTEPTEPSTQPTAPSTEPTEPSTQPTAPSTEPTEPSTQPTAPTTQPTAPSTEPTEPSTQPTAPTTQPTAPTTQPTAPTTVPTEPTTKHPAKDGEIIMNVTAKKAAKAGAGFYFAHDENALVVDSLVTFDETSPEVEGKVDASKFTAGDAAKNLTPAEIYEANKADNAYVVKAVQIYYNGLKVVDKDRKDVTALVYVGVKGDLTDDGLCNANDATRALIHAAQVGTTKAGEALPTITKFDDIKIPAAVTDADKTTFDNFLIFLADINTEADAGEKPADSLAVNAEDATDMLKYAARVGTNPKKGEAGYKTVSELWTLVQGEANQTAYSKSLNKKA
jgi:exonuclease VII small subunit